MQKYTQILKYMYIGHLKKSLKSKGLPQGIDWIDLFVCKRLSFFTMLCMVGRCAYEFIDKFFEVDIGWAGSRAMGQGRV